MKKQYINPKTEWYVVRAAQVICASGINNTFNSEFGIPGIGGNPYNGR